MGTRAFPIPNTGHIINYRETESAIRILRWYRSKRNVPRYPIETEVPKWRKIVKGADAKVD